MVKKLRRKNINTYDQRFAQAPARPEDYHRPKPSAAELDAIFRLETERSVSNDWVVRYPRTFSATAAAPPL